MKPEQLRRWIEKYGTGGLLLAGSYLGWRHLWMKRWVVLICGILAALVAGTCVWSHIKRAGSGSSSPSRQGAKATRPDTLLAHAARVADIKFDDIWDYRWISSKSFIVSDEMDYTHNSRYPVRSFTLYDGNTGSFKHLQGPDYTVATEAYEGPSAANLSPDGRYLLWQSDHSGTFSPPMTEGMDSQDFHQWGRFGVNVYPRWLADSRHWIEFKGNAILIHDSQGWQKDRVLHWPAPSPDDIPAIDPTNFQDGTADVTVTRQNHLLLDDWHGDRSIRRIRLEEFKIGRQFTRLHRFAFSLPKGSLLAHVIAPTGDRIAWYFNVKRVASPEVGEVWVSRIDGTGWHRIGQLHVHASEPEAPSRLRLEWLPDGRRLSFYYDQALWIVTAN